MSNNQKSGCGCITCLGWLVIIAFVFYFAGAILAAILYMLPVFLVIFVIYVFVMGLAKIFGDK